MKNNIIFSILTGIAIFLGLMGLSSGLIKLSGVEAGTTLGIVLIFALTAIFEILVWFLSQKIFKKMDGSSETRRGRAAVVGLYLGKTSIVFFALFISLIGVVAINGVDSLKRAKETEARICPVRARSSQRVG
jgi:uncharacterized membrane protein